MTMEYLLPWITVIIAILTAIGFFDAKRKLNMAEGAKDEKQKALGEEIKCMKAKMEILENAKNNTEVNIAEINLTLKYLADTIQWIKNRVEIIAPPTIAHKKPHTEE